MWGLCLELNRAPSPRPDAVPGQHRPCQGSEAGAQQVWTDGKEEGILGSGLGRATWPRWRGCSGEGGMENKTKESRPRKVAGSYEQMKEGRTQHEV